MATASLATYRRKRNFGITPEPPGKAAPTRGAGRFVVQKHAASRLHYDFRLEWDGVLKSWAVPKGPSLDPADKRMAVEVEDHPLSYGDFEGVIPKGQYGAGSVILWDSGRWHPVGDAGRGFRDGKLKFRLEGTKLKGGFTLVRMRPRDGERQTAWLLIKEKDGAARSAQPLPPLLSPQLATLVAVPPREGQWRYELKLDGYRLLARVDGSDVHCFTRNGHDWSHRLPQVVAALRERKLPPCWLDGELVALDEDGVPDFQQLQNAFEHRTAAELRYIVFDLLFLEDADLRELGQEVRRNRLRTLLKKSSKARSIVQFSDTLEGDPRRLLAASRAAGFEGLIGKRIDAPYRSGRSRDWIKLKAGLRQEFVIGGFTDPQGSRTGLGSLLLGVHDEHGALRHVGNVGTGFDENTLASLRDKLAALETSHSPFEDGPQRVGTTRLAVPHWVKPKLVAEVSFAGWTAGNSVRQAVFHGLRDDKPARQITIERAAKPAAADKPAPPARTRAKAAASATVDKPGLRITNPGRVIDADSGITKGDLVAYYAAVAPLLLPHLKDRPVALLRAPSGVAGTSFFQKHAGKGTLPGLERLPRSLDPGHEPLLVIGSEAALLSAAQMNVVELHTWNAVRGAIGKPDRIVFDLDPGEGVTWKQIVEAAQLLRTLLDELGLKGFLKTSGGKGLHVVLPLKPGPGWDEAKGFSADLVRHLAAVIPQRFVARSGPRNRVGKVFVDYLRNGRGATTVAAWSARARPGMGISVPLSWDELPDLTSPPPWSVGSYAERIAIGNGPWKRYESARQSLKAAGQALARISGVKRGGSGKR